MGYHMESAVGVLRPFVGRTFRGISIRVNPNSYAKGARVTWQAPSSASRRQTVPIEFLGGDGHALVGTFFVVLSTSGKKLDDFSAYPEEEEVIYGCSSHFLVEKVPKTEQEKQAELADLTAYNVAKLD